MGRSKRRRQRRDEKLDLGSREYECPNCGHAFELLWLIIFELQEMTHGFVGWEIQNEYIACPRGGENANEEYWGPDAEDCPF